MISMRAAFVPHCLARAASSRMVPNVTHVGVSIAAVDGPELAAIDCDHRIRKQIQLLAQHNKPAANIANRLAVILAEVR
jgi:hypothetical protein